MRVKSGVDLCIPRTNVLDKGSRTYCRWEKSVSIYNSDKRGGGTQTNEAGNKREVRNISGPDTTSMTRCGEKIVEVM